MLEWLNDYGTGWTTVVHFPAEAGRRFLPFAIASSPVLRSTQPPNQWVRGVKWPELKLTTHLFLVLMLKCVA